MLDPRTRRWGADVAYVGAGAVLGVLFLLGSMADEPASSRPPLALDLGVGVAACLALLLRRRRPVALALTLDLAGMLMSSMAFGVTFIALYNVAVRRSWRVTAAVAAVQFSLVVVLSLFDSPSTRTYVETVLVVGLLNAVLITSGMLVRAQRRLVQSLRERARQAEEGQRLRVEEARHLERERLAREMHDVLAHRISLLAVHAGALEFRPDAPAEEVAEAAGVIRESARAALDELRGVIGVLREDGGASLTQPPQPTLADLAALVEESRAAGMRVTARIELGDAAPPAAVGRTAYRIAQEGLTNARKHAPGAAVTLTIRAPDGDLQVEVRSLAPVAIAAAAPPPGAGTGLIGLAERVALAGGTLEHGVDPSGAFVLRASLPR